MTAAAVSMVKDEADIITESVTRIASQVDWLVVADNGSTDGTREILDELARDLPITVVDDPEPGYYQAEKMTRLAGVAEGMGADWVVAFDADEMWYSPFGRIADILADCPGAVATAALYDHVATAADPAAGATVDRIGWRRRKAAPLQKVACRPSVPVAIGQGNHTARYTTTSVDGLLVVRHFPYRSAEQFESKVRNGAAAYAATDLPEDAGAHWRQYGRILDSDGPEALVGVFRKWFHVDDPEVDPSLIFDPCPPGSFA